MADLLSIKFRQGTDELVLQDLTRCIGLLSNGITFSGNTMTLSFQYINVGTCLEAAHFDEMARVIRELLAWLDRARQAETVGQGEPVELLLKQGQILKHATYGRDYVRWQIAGGSVEQPVLPHEFSGMSAFDLVLALKTRPGEGNEVPLLRAIGGHHLTRGAGGHFGHLRALDDCGIEFCGESALMAYKDIWDRRAGTASLWWEPPCAQKNASVASDAYGGRIYDTRKDIDGGAWYQSDEAVKTSWYQELGTFPDVVSIEFKNDTLYIYSLATQALYAQFNLALDNILHHYTPAGGTMRIASVTALNRRIYVGLNSDTTTVYGGLIVIDLEEDRAYRIRGGSIFEYNGPISQRNAALGWTAINALASGSFLANNDIAGVSVAYVQGKGQTVALATYGGAIIWTASEPLIKATVTSFIRFLITGYVYVSHVWLTSRGDLYWNANDAGANLNLVQYLKGAAYYTANQTDVTSKIYTAATDPALKGVAANQIRSIWVQEGYSLLRQETIGGNAYSGDDLLLVGGDAGLTAIEVNGQAYDNGTAMYYAYNWITGMMFGNVLGFWIGGYQLGAVVSNHCRQALDLTVNGFTAGALAAGDWDAAQFIYGPSLIFDGANDYLTSASAVFNVNNQALTLCAFVRPTVTNVNRYIINKGFAAGARAYRLTVAVGGTVRGSISKDGTNWIDAVTTKAMVANNWYFLAMTFDGTTVSMYIYGRDDDIREVVTTTTAAGNIFSTAAALAVGSESAGTVPFNGHMNGVSIVKEVCPSYLIEQMAMRGFTASRAGDSTYQQIGGTTNQVNSVCMSEDGSLVVMGTGTAADGNVVAFRHRWDRREYTGPGGMKCYKAMLQRNVFIYLTGANRVYKSPFQNMFFFDYGTYKVNEFSRGAYNLYAFFDQADARIKFKAGRTAQIQTAALSWAYGDLIHLVFRYGYDDGISIWLNGVEVATGATFDGFVYANALNTKMACGAGWQFGQDWHYASPVWRVYDFTYWPEELTDEEVRWIEYGRGEMPFMWVASWDGSVSHTQGRMGDNRAFCDNMPGDIPAGTRFVWTVGMEGTHLMGVRTHAAEHFVSTFEAEGGTIEITGETVIAASTGASGGAYLAITPTTVDRMERVKIPVARSLIEQLRLSGRYRLFARIQEVSATPACKFQFAQGFYSLLGYWVASAYDYATPVKRAWEVNQWLLMDFGEIVFPAVSTLESIRRMESDAVVKYGVKTQNLYTTSTYAAISLLTERPVGSNSIIWLDCIYLLPVDYANGMMRASRGLLQPTGEGHAFSVASGLGGLLGAINLGISGDLSGIFADLADNLETPGGMWGATWAGSPVLLPVGRGSSLAWLGCGTGAADDGRSSLMAKSYLMGYIKPYFMFMR